MSTTLPSLSAAPSAATGAAVASLRQLEWKMRHQVQNLLGGEYRSIFRGKGMEFDQVVRYTYGDDVRDIDWKVTARLGEPYRKKFVEERELTVLLVFEDSLSLQFGSGERTKRESVLEMLAMVMLLAAMNRDRIGIVHAMPGSYTLWKPMRGKAAIMHAAAQLLASPPPMLGDTRPVKMPWKFVGQAAPRHSVMVWAGDFAPRAEPPSWSLLKRRYHALGFRVDDAWERALPAMRPITVYDPVGQHLSVLTASGKAQQAAHGEWVAARDGRFAELFPDGRDRLVLTPEDSTVDVLVKFFHGHRAVA